MVTDELLTSPGEHKDDADLRKRLVNRVAIASAVVLALVAGLMLFDRAQVAEPVSSGDVARVEPPAQPIERPAADKAAEPAEAAKPADSAQASNEPEKEALVKDEPVAEPEHTEAPTVARAERPLTIPARPHQAMMRPGEPVAAVQKPEPAKEIARPGPHVAQAVSRPISAAAEAVRSFLVQVGVFGNVANAEDLRAKIEAAGIPARIETRVQVGPFATRQEAEQAREKLKSLGLDPGLIVARK